MNISILVELVRKAPRTYIIGNGGSYANAIHICNDLLGCGIKAYTLDPATLTAFSNDYGYPSVFERWIDVVGEATDCLVALSGSGTSENILRGIKAAERKRMNVWCEFGRVQGFGMQDAEQHQIWLGHEPMRRLRDRC